MPSQQLEDRGDELIWHRPAGCLARGKDINWERKNNFKKKDIKNSAKQIILRVFSLSENKTRQLLSYFVDLFHSRFHLHAMDHPRGESGKPIFLQIIWTIIMGERVQKGCTIDVQKLLFCQGCPGVVHNCIIFLCSLDVGNR